MCGRSQRRRARAGRATSCKSVGIEIKVFNSIDFTKSMHYNPLAYIRNEADVLKFVDALISNTKGEGKEGDPFWTKSETLLYCALIAYIIFEGPAEDRNMNTLGGHDFRHGGQGG